MLRILTFALFFALPVILFFGSLFSPDREYSERENRSLAQFPKLSTVSLSTGEFMTRFENYMSDQVIFREQIVSLKSTAERLMGKTEQNGVYIGKDGWLFEKPASYNQETVSKTVSAASAFCSDCGIKNQLFVLVPNSTSVVTDKLPSHFPALSQEESIKKIYSEMPDNIKCLDAYGLMQESEEKENLFYKNDHHWTTPGAKLVFDGIAAEWKFDKSVKYTQYRLSDSFYGTLASSSGIKGTPDVIDAIIPENSAGTYIVQNTDEMTKSTSLFYTDRLEKSNQYEVFAGGNYSKLVITTTADTENRLLIFKDSYANCMLPMLTPHFSKIVVIDARYYSDDIKSLVKDEGFTHMMILYNANTFLADTSLKDTLG